MPRCVKGEFGGSATRTAGRCRHATPVGLGGRRRVAAGSLPEQPEGPRPFEVAKVTGQLELIRERRDDEHRTPLLPAHSNDAPSADSKPRLPRPVSWNASGSMRFWVCGPRRISSIGMPRIRSAVARASRMSSPQSTSRRNRAYSCASEGANSGWFMQIEQADPFVTTSSRSAPFTTWPQWTERAIRTRRSVTPAFGRLDAGDHLARLRSHTGDPGLLVAAHSHLHGKVSYGTHEAVQRSA
jgi:hypothetical protein